jgi:protein-disulfide isomerase
LVVGRFSVAEIAPLQEALAPKVMGNPQAPVTLTEFASLTCPHCADFSQNYLPAIKKDFIDTGKVKLVYNDFPLDGLALAGSMLARCGGDKKYFGFVEVLFRSQQTWARAANPREGLKQVARLGGISDADFEACLANQELLTGIRKAADDATKTYGIDSTPAFLINGNKVELRSFADIHGMLEKAVGSK